MAPSFEDEETRKLAAEVAKLTGEGSEEAVRTALREKRERLRLQPPRRRRPRTVEEWYEMMERTIWSKIPDELLDQPPMTKEEKEELLGYGPEGF